jgi:hypothetical protein
MSITGDEHAQLIRDAVKECVLLTFGYRFQRGNDDDDIRFQLQTTEACWRSQFIVNEDERIVRLYAYLTDDGYSENLRNRVGELVHRLNEQIILGHFGYDWDSGGVSLHLVEDFRGRECSSLDVERMLNTLAFPIGLWQMAFGKIKRPEIKPIDAFNAAMIEADAVEEDADVSKGTRKALLTLM